MKLKGGYRITVLYVAEYNKVNNGVNLASYRGLECGYVIYYSAVARLLFRFPV